MSKCTPPCEHVVKAGDTFSSLALDYYGDGSNVMADKIASANRGANPLNLQVDQKLTIPK
jgi:nucleoid-associated protein YgaU